METVIYLFWDSSGILLQYCYQENFQLKDIIYYSSFFMGRNTLQKIKSRCLTCQKEHTCLRQVVKRVFQGWFNPQVGFLSALTMLPQDVFFLDTAHQSRSTQGVSPKFPPLMVACPHSKTNDGSSSIDWEGVRGTELHGGQAGRAGESHLISRHAGSRALDLFQGPLQRCLDSLSYADSLPSKGKRVSGKRDETCFTVTLHTA